MAECRAIKETMPFLLTESLSRDQREMAHEHIESCATCGAEWADYQDSWRMMGELPDVEVPGRVRERFLAAINLPAAYAPIIPFRHRPAARWLAQAAAVVVLAGGSYYAGHRSFSDRRPIDTGSPLVTSVAPAYSIAETRVLPASQINPNIEGRPNIQNVQFVDSDPADNKVGLSFDVTSRVTVTGRPNDKSMVRLLSYVLENDDAVTPSRSRAIEWVRQTYSDQAATDPEIATALAKVLRNDEHEGVRIRAAETLKGLPAAVSSQTRNALIDALKSDPNPAVRIKAVEALANLARNGSAFDPAMIDTLRQKAAQNDENLYVRVKAAEVLSNIRPQ